MTGRNTLGILGTTAAFIPVPVNDQTLALDNPVMLGLTILLFPLMRWNMQLQWKDGLILLTILLLYSVMLFHMPG